jgi:hypothetical protein
MAALPCACAAPPPSPLCDDERMVRAERLRVLRLVARWCACPVQSCSCSACERRVVKPSKPSRTATVSSCAQLHAFEVTAMGNERMQRAEADMQTLVRVSSVDSFVPTQRHSSV